MISGRIISSPQVFLIADSYEAAPGKVGCERSRNLDDRGHKRRSGGGKEQVRVEVIGPLPREAEHEYSDQHCGSRGKDYLHKGSERSASVNVCGFLKLVGDVLEALTHHEDIKSVLESETRNGEYPKRKIGVQEVYIRILKQLETGDNSSAEEVEYSEDIEITELGEHRQLDRRVRNYHRKDYEQEQDSVALELELRKAVTDQAADECLKDRA